MPHRPDSSLRAERVRAPAIVAVLVALCTVAGCMSVGEQFAAVGPATTSTEPVTVAGDRVQRGSQPWWFLGANSFVWSGDCGRPDEKMSARDVDRWFASMRHDGHGMVRLFFFPGWDVGRLDAAVASARRNGIYVVVVLADALGDCGQTAVDAAWLTDPARTATYRRHLVDLLGRYRGNPTVAWFEWFNEPGWAGGRMLPFLERMKAVADTVDPNRLFSAGTRAPDAVDGGANFAAISRSRAVDVVSMHEYDESSVESPHGPEVRAESAGKPVVVGEFGITAGRGCATGFDRRAALVRAKAQAYTAPPYAGALMWAWQPGGPSGCDLGNLDTDTATQAVLREAAPG